MNSLAVLWLSISIAALAETPAGWQLMKDRKSQCQMSVPPGWTADKIMPGNVTAPDKSANVIFGGKPAAATFQQIADMAKDMFKPVKVFEDTPKRVWFASAPTSGKASWYVVINSKPVCEAQIRFPDPAAKGGNAEVMVRQMVESLKPVQ